MGDRLPLERRKVTGRISHNRYKLKNYLQQDIFIFVATEMLLPNDLPKSMEFHLLVVLSLPSHPTALL